MLYIKEMDSSCFEVYDGLSMNVDVHSIYEIKRIDNGLGGFNFKEVEVKPYIKDLSVYDQYESNYDTKNWRFYMAFDEEKPIGAITIAGTTPNLDMLSGRDDLCILWDIRVIDEYKHQGVGQKLFDAAVEKAKSDGYKQMMIECQNNNVAACKFYQKQGALLSKIDMYAYYHEEECKNEVQLIWYLDLDK